MALRSFTNGMDDSDMEESRLNVRPPLEFQDAKKRMLGQFESSTKIKHESLKFVGHSCMGWFKDTHMKWASLYRT